MMSHVLACLVVGVAFTATALAGEDQLPEALRDAEPRQLMAVGFGLMQLSDDEKAAFGAAVAAFREDYRSGITREMRRNLPNQDRRLQKQARAAFDRLDERVANIVTDARTPGYRLFKKGLADELRGSRRQR